MRKTLAYILAAVTVAATATDASAKWRGRGWGGWGWRGPGPGVAAGITSEVPLWQVPSLPRGLPATWSTLTMLSRLPGPAATLLGIPAAL
jgi:hypothetical protein